MERSQKIIRTSVVGIVVNLILVAFKATVGLLSHSIAVLLDAVNNLSDALSSLITILGTKLAGRAPDKKHPYGYGRIEYLTGMIVAVLVLFAGLSAAKELITKLIHPEAPSYTWVSILIIAVGVVVKFLTGRYVKGVGESLSSSALIASGSDAFFDSILSTGTLLGALLNLFFGWNLEGIIGVVISVIIIKAGIEMLLDTLNSITGSRADKELTDQLKDAVNAYPEVHGAYDLTLHNYGPTTTIGSVHVELDDDMPAREIHRLTRRIASDVYQRFGIVLTVGVYAGGNSTPEHAAKRAQLEAVVAEHPEILQMHGFFVDEETKHVMFDLIVDFTADAKAVCAEIFTQLQPLWPGYQIDIVQDTDFSE